MNHRLEDRLALVTGGARGIGRAITRELLREGARVVIADVNATEMEETCLALSAEGKVDYVLMDVSDATSVREAVERVRDKHGPIEVLMNNAGIARPGLFDGGDPGRVWKVLAVDLAGAIYLARLVLPDMEARGWGRIASMSSMTGAVASPGFVIYSAAKAGLASFSEALDRELVRRFREIRATAVLPPSVRTQAFQEAKEGAPGIYNWRLVPPISVEQVARRTVRGLIRGRRRVYCGAQSYLAILAERISPRITDLVFRVMFRPPPIKRVQPAPAGAAAAVPWRRVATIAAPPLVLAMAAVATARATRRHALR